MPILEIEAFAEKSYDFIIVGGGTAGLTLAARLSENPKLIVGVIEAGPDAKRNLLVNCPGMASRTWDSDIDWTYKTVPQKKAKDRVIRWPRGRCLGGTSAINVMMISHPSKKDLDNFIELGNEGWGWDDYDQYFRKFETFVPPSDKASKHLATEYVDEDLHGTDGPLKVTLPEHGHNWVQDLWPKTALKLGLPGAVDPRTGSSIGGFNQAVSVDPKTWTRSYSASAYLWPNLERPNLNVVLSTLVMKIDFIKRGDASKATGVWCHRSPFLADAKRYSVRANEEVILCGGTVNSPQLLELSGIGSKHVLAKHNIDVVFDLPNVGENLSDHFGAPWNWEVADGIPTAETFFKEPDLKSEAAKKYLEGKGGILAAPILSAVGFISYATVGPGASVPGALGPVPPAPKLDVHIGRMLKKAPAPYKQPGSREQPGGVEQTALLKKQLLDEKESAVQLVIAALGFWTPDSQERSTSIYRPDPKTNHLGTGVYLSRPLSRGSIHIHSADPRVYPLIDPRYLDHPLDLEVLARALMYVQHLGDIEPLATSSYLKTGADGKKVPAKGLKYLETLEEAKEYVRAMVYTEYQPIGTCSMLPADKGGVVDTQLRVYGTENVRVCDASIFPTHVQGGIQSLIYATAEKAADMIKAQYSE